MAGQERNIRGKAQEAVGKAKQKAGEIVGDDELRLKGAGDRLKGKVRQAAGKVEETVRDAADQVKEKTRKHK